MSHSANLTEGNITKTLLRFALPFLLTSILQSLYGVVDMMVVGQFANASAMSAVSTGGAVFSGVTMAAIGLTTGGTVLIGQFLGAGSEDDARKTAETMFTLYAMISVVLAVILFFLAGPVLRLMNTPDEAFDQAKIYVRICACGLIFTFGYNSISAVLRGSGDSKHPMYFVVVACIFNIIGDLVLVGALHMQAAGAALATMLGQALSFVTGMLFMRRGGTLFDFKRTNFRIHKGMSSKLLKVGIPIALQEGLAMISFLILEAVINNMGVSASAAAGAADKLFTIGVIPSSAFSSAIAALVAQNIGAGKPERASASLRIGAGLSFAVAVVVFIWLKSFPASAARLFTQDADVISSVCDYLYFYAYEYLLCSLIFPINGLINGSGHTRLTLCNNLGSAFIVRVPLILIFYYCIPGATLYHVGLALPIASVVQLTVAATYYFTGKWKKSII